MLLLQNTETLGMRFFKGASINFQRRKSTRQATKTKKIIETLH